MGCAPAAEGDLDAPALHLGRDRDRVVQAVGVELEADVPMLAEGLDAAHQRGAGGEDAEVDFFDFHVVVRICIETLCFIN